MAKSLYELLSDTSGVFGFIPEPDRRRMADRRRGRRGGRRAGDVEEADGLDLNAIAVNRAMKNLQRKTAEVPVGATTGRHTID